MSAVTASLDAPARIVNRSGIRHHLETRMIDGIRQARAFLAVARLGSFVRAAAELHISQPALTVQVQQLEQQLGLKLLDRNNRSVALTKAGEDMLIPLERLIIDVESVMSRGRDLAALRRGIITVAAVPTVAATVLPQVLSDFSEAYPGMSVRLRDDVAANFIELVRVGDVDLGIGGQIDDDRTIVTQHLFADPLCVFVPLNHSLAAKRRIALHEVTDHRIILPARTLSVRLTLDHALEQQGLSIRPLYEANHFSTAVAFVNAGLGISILPHIAYRCYPSNNVRCIPIYNPALARQIVIAAKAGRTFSPAVEKFIEILRKRIPPNTATVTSRPRRRAV